MSKFSDYITECVGGGGETTINYDLGEDINSGDLVRIVTNSGTKVMKVLESSVAASMGSEVLIRGRSLYWDTIVHDTNSNKTVILYLGYDGDYHSRSRVGTVTGDSISFGTPSVFDEAELHSQGMDATFDSNSNKVVTAYYDYDGGAKKGKAVVGTVFETGISFGTPVEFRAENTQYISTVFDSNSNKVVIAFQDISDNNHGKVIIGTVSGTTISFGSEFTFTSESTSQIDSTFDSYNNKVVISYNDGGDNNYGKSVVGTVSGTTISFGSKSTFYSAGFASNIKSTFDSNANKVVVAFSHGSYNASAIAGTVSGTSIYYGSAYNFHQSRYIDTDISFDPNSNKIIITYCDTYDEYRGRIMVGTVSTSSDLITYEDEFIFADPRVKHISSTMDLNADKLVITFYKDVDYGDSTYSKTFTPHNDVVHSSDATGILQVSGTLGQSREVALLGGISDIHTGQTAGEKVYIQSDGALGSTATSYPIGRYISDTELLLTKAP